MRDKTYIEVMTTYTYVLEPQVSELKRKHEEIGIGTGLRETEFRNDRSNSDMGKHALHLPGILISHIYIN